MSEKKPTPPQANSDKKTPAPPASASPSAPHNPPAKEPDSAKSAAPAQNHKPGMTTAPEKPASDKAQAAPSGKSPDGRADAKTDAPKPTTPPAAAGKPAAPPPVSRAPDKQPASDKGLNLIALAVSVAALALAGYQFLQNSKLVSQLNDQRAVLQKETSRLDAADSANAEQLAALRSDVAAIQLPAAGMDRDSVVKTIAENIARLEKSVAEAQTSAAREFDKRLAALPQGLSREDVQSQIKQALATLAQGSQPTIDFSDEIAKVQASEATARQILAQIEGQAAQLDSRLQQALADAQKQLAELTDSRASTLNLVTLAQLAGHAGQYQAAAQYLQQAAAHLAAGDNAEWQGALADAAQRFRQLASQPSPHAAIDHLIARVGEWPIRNSGSANLIAPAADAAPQTLMDKVKHVGQEIIAHTVTVVPLDDEGLAWINHNPALQNIIRQNVRLDLAFARNALHMQDSAAYAGIAATLKAEIERYFDGSHAEVRAALDTLAKLESAQHALPDLAPVIQALRNSQ